MTIGSLVYSLSKLLGYEDVLPAREAFRKQMSTVRITSGEVNEILTSATNTELNCSFANADITYKCVDIDVLREFLTANDLSRYKYISTIRDCDDFSFMLQGDVSHWDPDLAVGIAWGVTPTGVGHAFNFAIGLHHDLWLIEPQANHVFQPEKLWRLDKLIM